MAPIVSIVDVVKEYSLGKTVVPALRGVSLDVHAGEFISIAGPSGSGKTTLLNLIGCVDVATRGTVIVAGKDTAQLSERELTSLRLNTIGFIFQSFNLVPVLSVFQNVEFPLLLQRKLSSAGRRTRVMTLLEQVGLATHASHRPSELSGGQRQRVAVARALVGSPQIVLADEPTANLDSGIGREVMRLLRELAVRRRQSVLIVSHDNRIREFADRVLWLEDGVFKVTAGLVVDPVCGMALEHADARFSSEVDGEQVFFCCEGCQKEFEARRSDGAPGTRPTDLGDPTRH
jgi:putative ABC transport system ATP-binding protein